MIISFVFIRTHGWASTLEYVLNEENIVEVNNNEIIRNIDNTEDNSSLLVQYLQNENVI